MVKVYIPGKKGIDIGMIDNSKEKLIILGKKDANISLEAVQKLIEAKPEIIFASSDATESYAFELGIIAAKEGISDIITDIPELKNISATILGTAKQAAKKAPSKNNKKKEDQVKGNKEKESEKEKLPPKNTVKKINPPASIIAGAAEKNDAKKPREEKTALKSVDTKNNYSDVTEEQIEKILKKHKLDMKYKTPVFEAVKIANDVTIDLIVRTKIAPIEDNKDECKRIGDIIKNEFVK